MIHPGDSAYTRSRSVLASLIVVVVQIVHAVGKPPDDKICFFSKLKNVVVLPAVGMHYHAAFFLPLTDTRTC